MSHVTVGRGIIRVAALAVLVLAVSGAAGWWALKANEPPTTSLESKPFESQSWKEARPKRDQIRLAMVSDILDSGRLQGKTAIEIEALLGPSEVTPFPEDADLGYDLGLERSPVAVDHAWLLIRLDSDGKVINAVVATD